MGYISKKCQLIISSAVGSAVTTLLTERITCTNDLSFIRVFGQCFSEKVSFLMFAAKQVDQICHDLVAGARVLSFNERLAVQRIADLFPAAAHIKAIGLKEANDRIVSAERQRVATQVKLAHCRTPSILYRPPSERASPFAAETNGNCATSLLPCSGSTPCSIRYGTIRASKNSAKGNQGDQLDPRLTPPLAAPASVLARLAFWIQLARSHASFHSMKRIENCNARYRLDFAMTFHFDS